MANDDDFEIINESGLSTEPVFEFVDINDVTEKNISTDNKSTTPDVVLPLLVPKPLVNEIPEVIQQQTSVRLSIHHNQKNHVHQLKLKLLQRLLFK